MNTLNVYALMQHPLRSTASDHLYSFRRHGRGRQFYLNLSAREVPDWMGEAPFDTVVYHTTFFSHRWAAEQFRQLLERAAPLKRVGRKRIALPQDEFMQTDLLNAFINEFEIDHVFTLASESEWPKIYPGVDRARVGFTQALPGYLADHTRRRIDRIVRRNRERPIEIGYRAWPGAPWLGRHGMFKGWIGERVAEAAPRHGVKTDISGRDSDVLTGDDWFRFLASCKYTLGVEGGASLLDPDGGLRERTERYVTEHPEASFDEIEAACFPGEDGKLSYFAIGPRNIEACATRTCQVLVEGDYQGVLRPGEHYIELSRDLSNLDEVLELIKRDDQRERITAAAYRDVVASGRFSYESLVRQVEAVPPASAASGSRRDSVVLSLRYPWERIMDSVSWGRVIYRIRIFPRIYPIRYRLAVARQRVAPYAPHRVIPAIVRRLLG